MPRCTQLSAELQRLYAVFAFGYWLAQTRGAHVAFELARLRGPAHLLLPLRLACGVGVGVAECVKEMMTVQ